MTKVVATRTSAYAAYDAASKLKPFSFERRAPKDNDVSIDISFCGVCHSDIHSARSEWGPGMYPMVPGHEIVGKVTAVGKKVKMFKPGDYAAVGCMVDSCRRCENCKNNLQQHCLGRLSFTYNSTEQDGKTPTYGGYSKQIVVDEAFVLKLKNGQNLESVAPLLCAGITTYSPLKRFEAGPGKRVAIMGLGGLGHMAVKFARALGAEVAMVSTSLAKKSDAKRLGAHEFILSTDTKSMQKASGRFDLIIDTISASHDVNSALALLKTDGTLVLVGAPPKPLEVAAFPLIIGRRKIAGSLIGGIEETQEMLDFCAKEKIGSDVEVIKIKDINTAYERMLKNDVRYRFVIDNSSL